MGHGVRVNATAHAGQQHQAAAHACDTPHSINKMLLPFSISWPILFNNTRPLPMPARYRMTLGDHLRMIQHVQHLYDMLQMTGHEKPLRLACRPSLQPHANVYQSCHVCGRTA